MSEAPKKMSKKEKEAAEAARLMAERQKAAEDAFERTSTDIAPWTVVPANYKWYARVKVVKTVVEALERAGLKRSD